MGDRVSIQFARLGSKYEDKSAVLFSHWGGMDFVNWAWDYARRLARERKGKYTNPLDRLEPQTVMMDFIVSEIASSENGLKRIESNYYITCSEDDGDNSDNGHYIIDLDLVESELAKE